VSISLGGPAAVAQEVVVLADIGAVIDWLQDENWWGEENRGAQLEVPRVLLTGINPAWRETAQRLTVPEKKEVFYRFMLPLIVHANQLVVDRRQRLLTIRDSLEGGRPLAAADLDFVRDGAVLLRAADRETAASLPASGDSLVAVVDDMLYKLDAVPPGLALGQAAYESGYGTSRFTIEGNALFGQWAYGGKGLVPEQQRSDLGDHRIAAFDWPFDSVRGYFLNLMSHPAYEEFRRLRATLRAEGAPLDSLVLADGLINYSERGQEYVDTLKGIIRVNNLEVADVAVFRNEPMRFVIGAGSPEAAGELRADIEVLRDSGELAKIIDRMRLE
jgi:uncharacterized FlgJ-related protein